MLNRGTWKQRFWSNRQYWNGEGPVFLYVGGEGALSGYEVVSGENVELAQAHGALLFALEHRFYGGSQPTSDLSLENMGLLSSHQALADLATFVTWANEEYGIPADAKWVTFGGSYPGALSAWARLKFPNLIHAAVASSGPVQAKLDFTGYHTVVAESLKLEEIGGSQLCYDRTRAAFQTVTDVVKSGQQDMYDNLQKQFCMCGGNVTNADDVATFVSDLADSFDESVQYDREAGPIDSVAYLCSLMNDTSHSPLTALAQFYKDSHNSDSCTFCNSNTSYAASLIEMMNTTTPPPHGVGLRQWIWQTCSQFGYYQTCEPDTPCPFSPYMTLASNTDICRDVYNMTVEEVTAAINFTNSWYGGNSTVAERVVYVDGTVDPWHALAVIETLQPESPAILIDGAAHCRDLRPSNENDTPALKAARKQIASYLADWLK